MSSSTSNAIPVIAGWSTGSVYEDQLVNGYLTAFNALTITDADPGQSSFAPQAGTAGTYGTFTLTADGFWTYKADNSQTAIQQLGSGQSLTDSFTAVSMDGSASQLVTVTINGANDVPMIGGVSTGSVTEDVNVVGGNLTTGGTLTISDVDQGQSSFRPQASAHGFYGTFTLTANGDWTYSVDNSQTWIQRLGAGESVSDSFYAASSDGTNGQRVTVTINGTHDDPVIQGGTTASVYENQMLTGGNLTAFNGISVLGDQGESTFAAQTSTPGTYGTFTLAWNGIWTYTADNSQAAIQQLGPGQSSTDSFTAVSTDGTLSVPVTVTIHGTNHVPVIGGVSTGSVTEDVNVSGGNLTAGGALTIADPDQGQSNFAPQAHTAGLYGTFTLAADGAWTYSANDSQRAIQQLGPGQSITDSFTATSSDGTAHQLVTVTINGTRDDPVVLGGTTGFVWEDYTNASNNLTTQGTLSVVGDLNALAFAPQAHASGTYGTFTLGSNGAWTYTADNSQRAIQQLALGQSLSDGFTAVSADGSLHAPVTVTIHGTNDVPVIGGTSTGVVNEVRNLDGAQLSTSGALTIADVDQGESRFFFPSMVMPGSNHYGTFTFDASGAWSYTLDTSQRVVQQLGPGESLQDSFTDLSCDGTASQVVTVTINGANHTVSPPNLNLTSDLLWRSSSTGDLFDWSMSGGHIGASNPLGPLSPSQWTEISSGDFNGDHVSDALWRNNSTGDLYDWSISGGHVSTTSYLGTLPASQWSLMSSGDFNGDGTSDLLWRNNSTGDLYDWSMSGGHIGSSSYLGILPSSQWSLLASGDFNGDGTSDLLWRNTSTGDLYEWSMNGGHLGTSSYLGILPSSQWSLLASGDFNGDGTSDLLWRNDSNGDLYEWSMSGGHLGTSSYLGILPASQWSLISSGDFNGDGTSDLLWRNAWSGDLWDWSMSGGQHGASSYLGALPASQWSLASSNDFNGDHTSDLLWSNNTTGDLYDWSMSGGHLATSTYLGALPPSQWSLSA